MLSTIRRMPELKERLSTADYDNFLATMPAADPAFFSPPAASSGLADGKKKRSTMEQTV